MTMKFLGPGVIYYALGTLNGAPAVKIGISRNVKVRMRALGTTLLAWHEGICDDEEAAHENFSDLALGNEWFRPEPRLLTFVAGMARDDDPPVFPQTQRWKSLDAVRVPIRNAEAREGEPVEVRFARRVRAIRSAFAQGQDRLGAAVGLDRFAIAGMERGKRKIGLSEAVRICDALGVDLVDMLGDAEPVLVTESKFVFTSHVTTR